MRTRSLRRRLPVVALALSLAAVTAGGFGGIAAATSSHHHHHKAPPKALQLAGTWKGSYSGSKFSGSFTVTWTQSSSTLSGTIELSNPHGSYTCDGSINGSNIQFGAVGVGATYTGSVSNYGKSMSGTWKSPVDHGSWSGTKS